MSTRSDQAKQTFVVSASLSGACYSLAKPRDDIEVNRRISFVRRPDGSARIEVYPMLPRDATWLARIDLSSPASDELLTAFGAAPTIIPTVNGSSDDPT